MLPLQDIHLLMKFKLHIILMFGSLDINQGDPHNGWDTDEFLNNIYDAVHIMLIILNEGGLQSGGMNYAKTRRSSTDLEDIHRPYTCYG